MKDPIREPVRRDVDEPILNENETMETPRYTERRPVRLMSRQPAPRGALGMTGDLVHFAPTWAGMFVSVALLLLLTPIGVAIGLSSGTGAIVWAVISLFVSFFVGGYAVGRTLSYADSPLASLHGLLCWALTVTFAFALSALLGGALLGPVAMLFGLPTAAAVPTAAVGWGAFFALLIGAVACCCGALVGNHAAVPAYRD